MKRGPPESPLQVFESSPAGPMGLVKFQHTAVASETGLSQEAVVTAPNRFRPASSLLPPLMPKPAMEPAVPAEGEPGVVSNAVGVIPVTWPDSFKTATSARAGSGLVSKSGWVAMLEMLKNPACWKKTI